MLSPSRILAVFAVLCLSAGLASAQVTPTFMEHIMTTVAEIYDPEIGDGAFDENGDYSGSIGPFQSQIVAYADDFAGWMASEAQMLTSVRADGFDLSAQILCDGMVVEPMYNGMGAAAADYEVSFDISEPLTFRLDGPAVLHGPSYLDVVLRELSGQDFISIAEFASGNLEISESVELAPGSYSLRVSIFSDISMDLEIAEYGEASYDFTVDMVGSSTAVGDGLVRPRMLSAGPNPSHGPTSIAFAPAAGGAAELEVLDLRGRRVRSLVRGDSDGGTLHWDGRDASGRDVPQGLYFVRMKDGAGLLQRKISIVR